MLTPEQMDAAGEYVATTYRQIEAELIEYLVAKMIEGDVAGKRVQTAIDLLMQSMPLELKRIIDSHADEIDTAIIADVKESMAASDAFDLKIIADSLGLTLAEEALTAQTAAVLASAREMVARDNLALSQAARAKFLQWSTWAATQAATGNMTVDKAMHKAVRELSRGGLSIPFVTYKDEKSGKTTVTNHVDVAVQRHLRSLIGQGAAQLTFDRMQEVGIEFVEVSSHIGSRPSHCEWQGRCYHVGGAVEVDGVRYEDFEFGTGYRGVCGPFTALGDQLLGVNCRHSFAPWVPGSPRAYHPDPESPSGLDNEEIYDLTQKQRYRERKIREAKRELAAAQQLYDANPSPENAAEVTKAKLLLQKRQEAMRKFIDESNAKCNKGTKILVRQPRREWAGDMPKITTKKELQSFYSGVRKEATPIWKNSEISSITDSDEMAQYVEQRLGVSVTDGFNDLPLEIKREIVAGVVDATKLYGAAELNTITVMASRANDGAYNPASATIKINKNASSPYLAGFHEAIHGIDAKKSAEMPQFSKIHTGEEYNLHSAKVLKEARKAVGLSRFSKKYEDAVIELMGWDPSRYALDGKKPFEVVAYALDYEAQGFSNALSKAIAERF